MKPRSQAVQPELRAAKRLWGKLSRAALEDLTRLLERNRLSVRSGDVQLLEGRWYVTHSGLIRLAQRRRCAGIQTVLERDLSDAASARWIFKAVVYKSPRSRGFVGYGDADPTNVSSLVRGAEMRMAETRAVNRALRKAYGIGLCSVEELRGLTSRPEPEPTARKANAGTRASGNGAGNSHPRLRDQLCLLIRQHRLDAKLIRCYAAEFCGTQELREATRESVESFLAHLAEWAARDRAGLLAKLNTYANLEKVPS